MAHSPLELYDSAYRLQYHDKNLPEAIRVYEAIIREFPDSNECGYSVIQLQKIKASDLTKGLQKASPALHPLLVVSFLTSFLALCITLAGFFFLFQQSQVEHKRTTLALISLGKMLCGQEEEAIKLIDELKVLRKNDIMPFELSTAMYLRHEKNNSREPAVEKTVPSPFDSSITLTATNPSDLSPPPQRAAKIIPAIVKKKAQRKPKGVVPPNQDSISYF